MTKARKALALTLALGALTLTGRAEGNGVTTALPLPLPDRPFLLISAPRRFLPSEVSEVRVQHRGEATLGIAIFRVHDPAPLLAEGRQRQGFSIAPNALGRASEALLAGTGPLPRRGRTLTLVRTRDVRLRVQRGRGYVHRAEESVVYDSYEEDESDVETWGVRGDRWSSASVALGRLPTGLYVVRATHAAWAGTTLLSVGSNALLVRRGDLHDEVRVLGPDGAPRAGVRVEARIGGSLLAAGTTDDEGALRLPASDRGELRFVAREGEDVTWADVAHARLPACDPRVFVGTGRPVFRAGEIVHVRGQVRGCDEAGNERPLANEVVELEPGADGPVRVTSDDRGDFVAELVAPRDGVLRAWVRGHESVRDVTIDARRLPERALAVTLDREWAAAGREVTVRIADEDGGWPTRTTVSVRTPAGIRRASIGPGRPAVVRFRMPPTDEVVARAQIEATLTSPGRVQTARAALWTGRRAEMIELQTPRTHGAEGESIPMIVRASDLAGTPRPGPLAMTVRGSDGNRALGPVRARLEGVADADGAWRADAPLVGAGPWWIEAQRGESVASLVVRDRPGPPALGARGELAVQPARDAVDPGAALDVDVRMPPGGAAWVTLEQGSVHASRLVRAPSGGGIARVTLGVPREARGMATVVATRVHGAEVSVASATVEVRTSRRFTLSATADRRSYAEGARARVVIEARDSRGAGRAAVASVWLADAGWWDLGDERHPGPTDYFALPGRPASAGDGNAPDAYGAEEGRHVEGWLEWNGRRDARATFRHAWGHGGQLVRVDARGSLRAVARAIAEAAGLRGAAVCAAANRALGVVRLRAEQLPWDLVALRAGAHAAEQLAAEEGTFDGLAAPYVQGGTLRFDCESPTLDSSFGGTGGMGTGTGAGRGGAGYGRAAREERLEGTLRFLGRVPLGADGRAEIEVPLPDHPGRWRIEALAIAEDGGGGAAHALVHTTRPLMASVQVPSWLRVGDESEAAVDVTAPGIVGGRVQLAVELGAGLEPVSRLPTSVDLDARGHGRVRFRVRAAREGAATVIARARHRGERDDVRTHVRVAPSAVTQPIAVRATIGPSATSVHVPLPPMLRDATVRVRAFGDIEGEVRAALEALRAPRWRIASLRLDRMGALLALRRALDGMDASETARELDRAVRGEVAELLRMIEADAGSDGALSFWHGRGRGEAMTAELVWGAWRWRDEDAFRASLSRAVDALTRAVDANEVDAHEAPVVAAALARAGDADRARRVLRRASLDGRDTDALVWAVRAASAAEDATAPYETRLARAIDAALAEGRVPSGACAGHAWFLCYARASERAALARAAEALLTSGAAGARARAARVASRLAQHPAELAGWGWSWGTSDADELALFARLDARPGASVNARVLRGGRPIARLRGEAASVVVPAGTGDLVIELGSAPGRFVRVAVDGAVEVDPAHLGRGSVPLERRIVEDGGERFLELELQVRRTERDVVLTAPLPAGLELTTRAGGGAIGMSTSGRAIRWWTAVDPSPPPRMPRMRRTEDGVTLAWTELPAGRYRVRVPITETAAGRFTAGPAVLRTSDPTRWALTPPLAR